MITAAVELWLWLLLLWLLDSMMEMKMMTNKSKRGECEAA